MVLQTVVLGEERRPKLENRLGPGRAPELLRAFDASIEELHGQFHVAARPGQSPLAITRVVHARLIPRQIGPFLDENTCYSFIA
jgi:hypothetical protein